MVHAGFELPGSSSLITEEHSMSETDLRQPDLGPLRAAAPFGSGGAWLVTGRRHQDPEAGR